MRLNLWQWILLVGLYLLPTRSLSQDILQNYIPLPPQELSVEQYLYHIKDITDLNLVYSSRIVEDRRIAIYSDSIRLIELLDTLFTKREIHYIFRDEVLILSPQNLAQKESTHLKITGVVHNSKNNHPIPFATIFVPNSSTGTIANYEGAFELYIPVKEKIDSLTVSCLGYGHQTIDIVSFLKGQVNIALRPSRFQIDEIIVRPDDPKKLILGALENKHLNYAEEPVLLTAFVRESSTQNDKHISLSEAIINIYKTAYTNDNTDMIQLVKGRRGSNVENSELVNLVVEGGLYNTMQLDIMKYNVSFLDPEFFDYYEYDLRKQFRYNGRQTYIIDFTFKEDIAFPGFDGKIYLDVESLALVRSEFKFSEEGLEYTYDLLIRKAPINLKINPKYGEYEVEYRFYDGKWNLNHARSDIALKVRKKRNRKRKAYICHFASSSEFVITGRTVEDFERIKYRDASKPGDILFEQISLSDIEFWNNQTIIIPEEPLLETIEKLRLETNTLDSQLVKTKPEAQ